MGSAGGIYIAVSGVETSDDVCVPIGMIVFLLIIVLIVVIGGMYS